jgi:hypothetical protein
MEANITKVVASGMEGMFSQMGALKIKGARYYRK